jgi:hypothetical protein
VFDHNTLQPFFTVMSKRISRALAQAYDVDFVIDHRYRLPKEDQVKLAGDFAAFRASGQGGPSSSTFRRLATRRLTISCSTCLAITACRGTRATGSLTATFPARPAARPIGQNTASFGRSAAVRPDLVRARALAAQREEVS